jgi:hypothetical protein
MISQWCQPIVLRPCGELYWNDVEKLARLHGFLDPRLLVDRPLEITNPIITTKLGEARFYSATYRLLKLVKHHTIETGRIFPAVVAPCPMTKPQAYQRPVPVAGELNGTQKKPRP